MFCEFARVRRAGPPLGRGSVGFFLIVVVVVIVVVAVAVGCQRQIVDGSAGFVNIVMVMYRRSCHKQTVCAV